MGTGEALDGFAVGWGARERPGDRLGLAVAPGLGLDGTGANKALCLSSYAPGSIATPDEGRSLYKREFHVFLGFQKISLTGLAR